MSAIKKVLQKSELIVFLVITFLSFYLRFADYPRLLNFHHDPAFYFHEVKDMVDSGKPRLTGPIVLSKMVDGRGFFTGPTHYYFLAALGLLSNWDVVFMSAVYTSFWLLAYIILFFWLRFRFGKAIALLIYGLLSFYPAVVPISRMIWNPHFLPFFGSLFLVFLDLRKKKPFFYFLSGLFFGLAFSAHYAAVLWLPIILCVFVNDYIKERSLLRNWILFILAVIIAESPFILFELRNNFYNLRTFYFQLQNYKPSAGYTLALSYYYVFPYIPVAAFLLAAILKRLKSSPLFPFVNTLLVVLIFVFLIDSFYGEGKKTLYPYSWNLSTQRKVTQMIIDDNEPSFEVAETINSDTRALDLRWWLRMEGVRPMDVTQYDKAEVLYLVAPNERPPEEETVWEVISLRPFEIKKKENLGGGLIFYKLVKMVK
ncbi:hypothetical protein C4578_03975 [Candidatus Microgenomates bacterium]|jgi:hypothetical protein|nr:MAG: hypothetical protein C4578_03975 [Candidatus Microgenomates bacterium]